MRRFLAKHPFLAAAVLLLPVPGVFIGAVYASFYLFPLPPTGGVPYGPPAEFFTRIERIGYATCLLWPLLCCFPLGLFRRRAGARMGPLLVLIVLAPLQLYLEFFVIGVVKRMARGRPFIEAASFTLKWDWEGLAPMLGTVAVATAVGLLAGWLVALWLLRTGRWETIVPIPKPKRSRFLGPATARGKSFNGGL